MKAFKTVLKILAAVAAVAGVVFIVATYGDKIVAWAKSLLGKLSCLCKKDCSCVCEEDCDECPCEDDCDNCPCDCCCDGGCEIPEAQEAEVSPEDFEG